MSKTFAMAQVKAVKDAENPNGEFEVILSAETVDRDGEIIDAKAFEPLPESVPFHAFHDFHDPIGRAVPFYDGDVLKARGVFASTARAQEIRTLVTEGVIGHTSVGFMAAVRQDGKDSDAPHITKGELLEGSFVSVPSNREAAVLMAKEFDSAAKSGARNSSKDSERLQSIHDLAVDNGATCEAAPQPAKCASGPIVRKAHGMTANTLRDALDRAVQDAYGSDDAWAWVRDYADDWVVYEIGADGGYSLYRESYSVSDATVTLAGSATEVVATTTYAPVGASQPTPPEDPTTAPETPDSEESGKSPASEVAEARVLIARTHTAAARLRAG